MKDFKYIRDLDECRNLLENLLKPEHLELSASIKDLSNDIYYYFNIEQAKFLSNIGYNYFDGSDISNFKHRILNYCPKYKYSTIKPISKLVINYPLKGAVLFTISLIDLTWIELLNIISKAYNFVYNNEIDFGVWGHSIGDLVLSKIKISQPIDEEVSYIILTIDS